MNSPRLPGKVLKPLAGRPMLEIFLRRLSNARLDAVIVATTDSAGDDPIVALATKLGYAVTRGSELDVLDRFTQCARSHSVDRIVRVTSDCPAIDAALVNDLLLVDADLVVNNTPRTYPHGMDAEVFTRSALESAWRDAREPHHREHVTPFLREHPDRFRLVNRPCPDGRYGDLRVTVDWPEDLELLQRLFDELGTEFGWRDVVAGFERHPEWAEVNRSRAT